MCINVTSWSCCCVSDCVRRSESVRPLFRLRKCSVHTVSVSGQTQKRRRSSLWILAVSLDHHEEMVGSIERVMVDSGAAVSVCPLGCAPEVPMFNHHAGQKEVEYENGDGGLVNVNLKVADVTRPLVAVSESQERGMTVVMGPHGSL